MLQTSDLVAQLLDHLELHFTRLSAEMAAAVASATSPAADRHNGNGKHPRPGGSAVRLRAALRSLREATTGGQAPLPFGPSFQLGSEVELLPEERAVFQVWIEQFVRHAGPAEPLALESLAPEAAPAEASRRRRLARLRLEPLLQAACVRARDAFGADIAFALLLAPGGEVLLEAVSAPELPRDREFLAALEWNQVVSRLGTGAAFLDDPNVPCLPDFVAQRWPHAAIAPIRMPEPASELVGALVAAAAIDPGSRRLTYVAEVAESAGLTLAAAELILPAIDGAVASERVRIARELHDGLANDLAALVAQVKVIEHDAASSDERSIERVRGLAEEALREARDVLSSLRNRGSERGPGERSSLETQMAALAREGSLALRYRMVGDAERLRPAELEVLLQVAREAMNNATRHGRAKSVRIEGDLAARPFWIEIQDDGQGFDPESAVARSSSQGHYGIAGMEERAHLIGASVEVRSSPGKGAVVFLRGPSESRRVRR